MAEEVEQNAAEEVREPPRTVTVGEVRLHLVEPQPVTRRWVGQRGVLEQLLACWLTVAPDDLPLAPRLVGPPGLGKTTLALAAAKLRGQQVYVQQCTADTRPEDLLVTPVLAGSGKISYHASPLVSAMLRGGICVLDEANRMNEKSWASLAPLLDHRRNVESIIAGVRIPADPGFRCCVTVNDDASTYEIPDYIISRLQPTIELDFPSRADELAILQYNVPFATEQVLGLTVDFLQKAHGLGLSFSLRDGINAIRYAMKRHLGEKHDAEEAWKEGIAGVLGKDALDLDNLAARQRRWRGEGPVATDLADFFRDDE